MPLNAGINLLYHIRGIIMSAVLTKAACFIFVIFLGYFCRRSGMLKSDDFNILSRITLRVTLPAAIIVNLDGMTVVPSMFIFALMGFGGGVLYMLLGYITNLKGSDDDKAFAILNLTGYNIGNCALPFAQEFVGPMGVLVTSLFDLGNSVLCLGGAYSVAHMVKSGEKFSPLSILRAVFKSVAFDTYIFCIVLALLHLQLPRTVISIASFIGNANAFIAMFMLGVGFKLSGDLSQLRMLIKCLSVRFVTAIALVLIVLFVTPFEADIKAALCLLLFSPIATAAPAFTSKMGGNFGLASAVSSIALIISLCSMMLVLILTAV